MGKDVIVACDFACREQVFEFLDKFTDVKPFVKIGMELFYAEGPQIVRDIKKTGPDNAREATALTKESMQQMTETLTKGQDGIDLHQISPEQIVGGIMGTMAMMEVPEAYNEQMTAALGQIQTGLFQYFSILNQVKDNEENPNDQRSPVPCLSGGRPASG